MFAKTRLTRQRIDAAVPVGVGGHAARSGVAPVEHRHAKQRKHLSKNGEREREGVGRCRAQRWREGGGRELDQTQGPWSRIVDVLAFGRQQPCALASAGSHVKDVGGPPADCDIGSAWRPRCRPEIKHTTLSSANDAGLGADSPPHAIRVQRYDPPSESRLPAHLGNEVRVAVDVAHPRKSVTRPASDWQSTCH